MARFASPPPDRDSREYYIKSPPANKTRTGIGYRSFERAVRGNVAGVGDGERSSVRIPSVSFFSGNSCKKAVRRRVESHRKKVRRYLRDREESDEEGDKKYARDVYDSESSLAEEIKTLAQKRFHTLSAVASL
jgi:hypothetical protein